MQTIRHVAAIILLCAALLSCSPPGSGDGAGDGYDPIRGASVEISVDPNEFGVGELTEVQVRIEQVHPAGVLVIVRYPSEYLNYLPDSSFLQVDDDEVNVSPVFGPADRARIAYHVYYLTKEVFAGSDHGILKLHLLGQHRNRDVEIEVDQHLHDVTKEPADEFTLADPNFSADDSVHVSVLTSTD